MLKAMAIVLACVLSQPAVSQPQSKYQVATITAVKLHQSGDAASSDASSYDVSLRVGDTLYTVLYTPPLGTNTVNYAAGREILVLVGKNTISYNDLLGVSHEAPIVSQKPAGVKSSK